MADKLGVINAALDMLGEQTLASVDDTSTRGLLMARMFPQATRWVFEQDSWHFAMKRDALALSASAPAWGYEYYYSLPADCYRAVAVSRSGFEHDDLTNYRIENGYVACDESGVYLRYISSDYVVSMGSWPQYFSDYVAAAIAKRAAPRLNKGAIERIDKDLRLYAKVAMGANSVIQPPAKRRPGAMVMARVGGGRFNEEQSR